MFVSLVQYLRLIRLQDEVGMKEMFIELCRMFLQKTLQNISLIVQAFMMILWERKLRT